MTWVAARTIEYESREQVIGEGVKLVADSRLGTRRMGTRRMACACSRHRSGRVGSRTGEGGVLERGLWVIFGPKSFKCSFGINFSAGIKQVEQ